MQPYKHEINYHDGGKSLKAGYNNNAFTYFFKMFKLKRRTYRESNKTERNVVNYIQTSEFGTIYGFHQILHYKPRNKISGNVGQTYKFCKTSKPETYRHCDGKT